MKGILLQFSVFLWTFMVLCGICLAVNLEIQIFPCLHFSGWREGVAPSSQHCGISVAGRILKFALLG